MILNLIIYFKLVSSYLFPWFQLSLQLYLACSDFSASNSLFTILLRVVFLFLTHLGLCNCLHLNSLLTFYHQEKSLRPLVISIFKNFSLAPSYYCYLISCYLPICSDIPAILSSWQFLEGFRLSCISVTILMLFPQYGLSFASCLT